MGLSVEPSSTLSFNKNWNPAVIALSYNYLVCGSSQTKICSYTLRLEGPSCFCDAAAPVVFDLGIGLVWSADLSLTQMIWALQRAPITESWKRTKMES